VRLPPDGLPNNKEAITMNANETSTPAPLGRVIGLDLHPEVFSAAALAGRDAATAQVEQHWDRRPTAELEQWGRALRPGDLVVVEASGNTFTAAERLRAAGVAVVVLESQRAGQIRKTYCANDRLDAVKLGRIYLSGLAQVVWQPDVRTRERREALHCHRQAVTTATRARNRLKSFLSDHHVRLKKGVRLAEASGAAKVQASATWTGLQKLLLEEMLGELQRAEACRRRLVAAMAQEVAADRSLLQLMRLLGVRHIIAFAIAAVVGDITRFANPKKLVAYLGLTPSVADSGKTIHGRGELVSFGRGDLRALLIQSAQNALQQKNSPLHTWGWKLCLRKAHKNVAIAAVARKLAVSIWYLMRGLFTPLKQLDTSLQVKLGKLASAIGVKTIRHLGYESKTAFIAEKAAWLLNPT
jgi:transposase